MAKLIVGVNDFATWCKQNHKESALLSWNYALNDKKPNEVLAGTHTMYHFKCNQCGYEFEKSPHDIKLFKGNGCKYCGRKLGAKHRKEGFAKKNNFGKQYPDLVKEWDWEKNDCSPFDISCGINKAYYWICQECGKSYLSYPYNRIKGVGCPRCKNVWHTSFPEQAIFYYISQVFDEAINGSKIGGFELDIYLPSKRVAIEYDGEAYHKDEKQRINDNKKNDYCANEHILLIRIRERNCWKCHESDYLRIYTYDWDDEKGFEQILYDIFQYLDVDCIPDINIERDKNLILDRYMYAKEKNSVAEKYPHLKKEWDYERNYPLVPERFDYGSNIAVYWKCPTCGYSYKQQICAKTIDKVNCPCCSNREVWFGHNDFQTWCVENNRIDLLIEWDYDKNLKEKIFTYAICGFNREVNWKCSKCGNTWNTVIYNRKHGKGCKKCATKQQCKKVKCIETNQVFNSIHEAIEHLGAKYGCHIIDCCKGKRKTAYGYQWKYVE